MFTKFACALLTAFVAAGSEPNPPAWDAETVLINPTQAQVDAVFATNGGNDPANNGEWSENRYAFFFNTGAHQALNLKVGYYTTVHGLGHQPISTLMQFVSVSDSSTDSSVGGLNNHWRSVENLMIQSEGNNKFTWAVSQGCSLRRVHINGATQLFDQDYNDQNTAVSGGFIADVFSTNYLYSEGQQQWFSRNLQSSYQTPALLNTVYVGVSGAPGSHCALTGGKQTTLVTASPKVIEKPYIVQDIYQPWKLMIPKVQHDKVSVTSNWEYADEVDFSEVYVASPTDTAAKINAKLAEGLHLVLQPGIYRLEESIKLNKSHYVVLGLGMATLIPMNGTPAIEVGDVYDVRIAGVILEAGVKPSETLLKFSDKGYEGSSDYPSSLNDVYARAGRYYASSDEYVRSSKFLEINSGNVIMDNIWVSRSNRDYYGEVKDGKNPVLTGIEVNGDDVIGYGISSEHTLGDMLQWNGDNGRVYFYQSEFAKDASQKDYADVGYAAYRVGDNVTSHEAWGVSAYSNFNDEVTIPTAIKSPETSEIKFHNSMTAKLGGMGGIQHVLNNEGTGSTLDYFCESSFDEMFLQ